tara:strand:- start:3594 stop:5870 length:2277 start_codon:yes stop_codon:yes gene_type:complete
MKLQKQDNMNDQHQQLISFIKKRHGSQNGFIELRPCYEQKRGIDTRARRWFSTDEFVEKVEHVIDYCRRQRLGCFVGVLNRSEKGRGDASSVDSGNVIWTDIDDKDHGGSRDAVWSLVNGLAIPPSVIVESGGGLHLYYWIDEETPADQIAELNERLAKCCGGDSCHDKARILRLPCSYHQKDSTNVKFVRFLKMDTDLEYSIEELLKVFPPVPNSVILKTEKITHMPQRALSAEMESLMKKHKRLNDLFNGFGKTGGDKSGSGYDFAFSFEALWLGATKEDTVDALSLRVKGSKGNQYILTTVARAHAKMTQRRSVVVDVEDEPTIGDPNVYVELDKHPSDHHIKHLRNKPKITNLNLFRILNNDVMFSNKIRFNQFKQRIEVAFKGLTVDDGDFDRITDVHSMMMRHEISKAYQLEFKRDQTNETIEFIAHQNRVHPVREYLTGLKWDGVKRIDNWLFDYCNARVRTWKDDNEKRRDNAYLIHSFGRKFLLSCIARVMTPGVKVDTVLILVGKQGSGKSTVFRILAKNDDWFRDSSINVNGGRDAYSLLSGVWLYEFPELHQTRSRANEAVKAFITSTHDSYRPAYARFDIDVPRQVVFCGTSNEAEILRDPTGSRRFWVVETNEIFIEKLSRDVDQLWAEAFDLWKSKTEPHWFEEDEEEMIEHARKYEAVDVWSTAFNDWIGSRLSNPADKQTIEMNGLSMLEILEEGIGLQKDRVNRADQMRMSGLLNGLGWSKNRLRINGKRTFRWLPPKEK